jgi:hypothetical protein
MSKNNGLSISAQLHEIHGIRILEFAKSGPPLADAQHAVEMIAKAMGCSANLVMLPVERLDETFFHLGTGLRARSFRSLRATG